LGIMNKSNLVIPVFAVALMATSALAVDAPSDAKIRHDLIGSWIVTADSNDRTPETDRMQEIFKADGTYTLLMFSDPECRVVAQRFEIGWKVQDHVLISRGPDGNSVADDVVSIGDGKMTLRSLDDGTTYTRVRKDSCAAGHH